MYFNRKIIKYLEKWKDRQDRKPLILRGARQVGKTVSVRRFAQKFFKGNFIEINLENPEHERLFREELSVSDFEQAVQLKFNAEIKDGETLLFIDEIQNSSALMKLLRFLYEERPLLHVIAAGSLLEAKIKTEGFSFPVGRVEYAYVYPLNFFEFIEAKGENKLLELLKDIKQIKPLPQAVLAVAEKEFNEYMLVGGMPEAVKNFIEHRDFNGLNRVYNSLFTSYAEDLNKYASEAKVKYLVHCLETAPLYAGQNITYEHFGESAYRSREMKEAFDALEKAMLVYRVMGSSHCAPPLAAKKKKSAKILFLDIGLVNYRLGIREKLLSPERLNEFYRGRIAEQVVGQHLLSEYDDSLPEIRYWYRDVPGSTAEIDYIFTSGGAVIPLEVKSGKSGSLRSLQEFAKASGAKVFFRIYNGNLNREEVKTENGCFELISIPFFLLPIFLTLCQKTS